MNLSFEERLARIEAELELIRARNARVETDKAWEKSKPRTILIGGTTYIVATIVFSLIDVPSPFFNALIPTVGYLLSTLTLPKAKQWWCKHQQNEKN